MSDFDIGLIATFAAALVIIVIDGWKHMVCAITGHREEGGARHGYYCARCGVWVAR